MSLVNLYQYIRHLSENQQRTQRYEIALWKKLIYPLATLVMIALALPFAYAQDRMGVVSVKVFIGVMLGILFHMLNGMFSHLGVINSWKPLFSAVTPSVIFLLAASFVAMVGGAKMMRVPDSRSCRNSRSRSSKAQSKPAP